MGQYKQCWWKHGKKHCETVNYKTCVKLGKQTKVPAWIKCWPKQACGGGSRSHPH